MESRLFQALKAFKGADGCEANLFEEFKKIAEAAFFSGYFLVNGGCKDAYKLKLTCIEFYYHEDDGNIKDKIKYLPQFGITECLIQYKCSVNTPPPHAIRSG